MFLRLVLPPPRNVFERHAQATRNFATCGDVRSAAAQPPEAAAEPSRFHPIPAVVSPRRGAADPAKALLSPGAKPPTPKRRSFRPGKIRPSPPKRFFQPPPARAAQNDGRCGQGDSAPGRKSAFFVWRGLAGPKTTVVLAGADAPKPANASFADGCIIPAHFLSDCQLLKSMTSNQLPKPLDDVFTLAEDMTDGCHSPSKIFWLAVLLVFFSASASPVMATRWRSTSMPMLFTFCGVTNGMPPSASTTRMRWWEFGWD